MVELSAKFEKIDSKLYKNNSIEELDKKVFEMGQIIENYNKLFGKAELTLTEMKKQNVELRKSMEKDKRDANLYFLEIVEHCETLEKRILKLEHEIRSSTASSLKNWIMSRGVKKVEKPELKAVMPPIRSLNKHATEFQP